MHPILVLRNAIVALLVAKGKTATARYVEYTKKAECEDGKYFVAIASENDKQFNNVDRRDYLIDVVYQRALPTSTPGQPAPLENNPFLDGCVTEFATVKTLFQEGGEYRGVSIGGCVMIEMLEQQMYSPMHLLEHQIFTSSFRMRFRLED
ncbi:MAG: hypothetical protein ACK506_16135 [Pirellula sp.]